MQTFKKILIFFSLFLYVMGVIGGIGSALYLKSYPCALGCLVLAVMAFPTAKALLQKLME